MDSYDGKLNRSPVYRSIRKL